MTFRQRQFEKRLLPNQSRSKRVRSPMSLGIAPDSEFQPNVKLRLDFEVRRNSMKKTERIGKLPK